MPSIDSRLIAHPSEIADPSPPPSTSPGRPVAPNADPGMSPVLRCPLPVLTIPSPDNLRQYYSGGSVPQYRFPAPPPISTVLSQTGTTTQTTFSGSLITTANAQDTVAVAGATPNSFITVSPTNSVAAGMTGVYAKIVTSGQVVVHHPSTAGGTFNISITA